MTLHQRIRSDIEAKIVSGEWQPGVRIPFEHELSAAYGCSRMTVSKALTQLAQSGLIERRRKSGSFVRRPVSQSAVLEIHGIADEVAALGLPYQYELLDRRRRKSNQADRERLGVAAATQLLALSCRHFAGERPFCLEQRLISLDAVPEAEGARFTDEAPGPWLLSRVPWSAAEHRISADRADQETAAALSIAMEAPCLLVERRTWNAGLPVTFVRLTYPAEAHALVARFTP